MVIGSEVPEYAIGSPHVVGRTARPTTCSSGGVTEGDGFLSFAKSYGFDTREAGRRTAGYAPNPTPLALDG